MLVNFSNGGNLQLVVPMGRISKRIKKGIWVSGNAASMSMMVLKLLSPSCKFTLAYFALVGKSSLLQTTLLL